MRVGRRRWRERDKCVGGKTGTWVDLRTLRGLKCWSRGRLKHDRFGGPGLASKEVSLTQGERIAHDVHLGAAGIGPVVATSTARAKQY